MADNQFQPMEQDILSEENLETGSGQKRTPANISPKPKLPKPSPKEITMRAVNAIVRIKKPKLITLAIIGATILIAYFALLALSVNKTYQMRFPNTNTTPIKSVIPSPKPQSEQAKQVDKFNSELENWIPYEKRIPIPSPDLEITF